MNRFSLDRIEPTTLIEHISISRLTMYMCQCKRKYYWSYIRNLQGVAPILPFFEGSAFHSAIELWNSGKSKRHIKRTLPVELDKAEQKLNASPKYHESVTLAKALVLGAVQAFLKRQSGIRISSTKEVVPELRIEASICNLLDDRGVRFLGYADSLVKDPGKPWYLEEYKFYSSMPRIRETMLIDWQLQLYPLMIQRMDSTKKIRWVKRAIYLKPKIRQKRTEKFSEFVKRLRVCYDNEPDKYIQEVKIGRSRKHSNKLLKSFISESVALVLKYERGKDHVMDEDNWPCTGAPRECAGFMGRCPFIMLCSQGERDPAAQMSVRPKSNHRK